MVPNRGLQISVRFWPKSERRKSQKRMGLLSSNTPSGSSKKWRTNVPLRCELPQYLSPPVAQTLALPKDSADDPTEDRVLRDACGPLRRNNAPLSSPMAMGEIVGMNFMVKALTMAATTLLRPPGQSIQVFRSLPKAHPCSEGASCHLCGPGEGKISVKRGAPSCPQRSGANHYNADSFRCNTRS